MARAKRHYIPWKLESLAGCEDCCDDGDEGAEERWDQPGWSCHSCRIYEI